MSGSVWRYYGPRKIHRPLPTECSDMTRCINELCEATGVYEAVWMFTVHGMEHGEIVKKLRGLNRFKIRPTRGGAHLVGVMTPTWQNKKECIEIGKTAISLFKGKISSSMTTKADVLGTTPFIVCKPELYYMYKKRYSSELPHIVEKLDVVIASSHDFDTSQSKITSFFKRRTQ